MVDSIEDTDEYRVHTSRQSFMIKLEFIAGYYTNCLGVYYLSVSVFYVVVRWRTATRAFLAISNILFALLCNNIFLYTRHSSYYLSETLNYTDCTALT